MDEFKKWMETFEFEVDGLSLARAPVTDEKLFEIIPEIEWDFMERAGILAFQCRAHEAEKCRGLAGYAGLDNDPGATKYDSEMVREQFRKMLEQDE